MQVDILMKMLYLSIFPLDINLFCQLELAQGKHTGADFPLKLQLFTLSLLCDVINTHV